MQHPVEVLHTVRQRDLTLRTGLHDRDDQHLEEGDHQHGQQQRDHQIDRHRPGEEIQEVAEHARQGEEQRIEDHADADRRQQQRGEELAGALDGGIPARIASSEVVEIAVDDDDRVVDDHAQHDDQRGQNGQRGQTDDGCVVTAFHKYLLLSLRILSDATQFYLTALHNYSAQLACICSPCFTKILGNP